MDRRTITVTEAARNFADCVNRVHYQNMTFVLLKNGSPFARLGPEKDKACLGRDLAKVLAGSRLPAAETRAWYRDLERARKKLSTPHNKWQ
jgi:antitoxin (DNA-binding transcriptional repressor) of toxin-antitoxin stability system